MPPIFTVKVLATTVHAPLLTFKRAYSCQRWTGHQRHHREQLQREAWRRNEWELYVVLTKVCDPVRIQTRLTAAVLLAGSEVTWKLWPFGFGSGGCCG